MTYKRLNNLTGWGVFAIATLVYLLTIEPAASWWDCGEYIATSYKLEVGHPPGAPLFQLIGRLFTMFASDVTYVSMMINVMSALCSSFTILFLFWSITMLGRRLVYKGKEELEITKIDGGALAVLFAGVIGALAYTFSDSFWFSAVEGEVYAMSSFFTALAFWSILKWNECKDDDYAIRWLIFIAFQIGLSIGVHLLNLLTVPAIVYIYYFKKYNVTTRGFIYAGLLSLAIVAFILNGIVPETVALFADVELFSVNTLGMPFNLGTIILAVVIVSALVVGILYTAGKIKSIKAFAILGGFIGLLVILNAGSFGGFVIRTLVVGVLGYLIFRIKNNKFLLSAGIMSMTFILIGYTSFLVLVIRANTNTPVNENAPKDAVSLLSYLNREQYGSWPLVYGPYFNAPVDRDAEWKDLTPYYVKDEERGMYVVTDSRKGAEPVYESEFCTLFPRMYSSSDNHVRQYQQWMGKDGGTRVRTKSGEVLVKPTFADNIGFMLGYQIRHMYFRYLMWNFSGRQNNIENGGGSVTNGNWITGWDWFDNTILGLPTMNDMPKSLDNPAHNKFYMLPFILGLIGLFYQIKKDQKNAFVVGLLFLMTGLAIVFYLNQKPVEPRERDYAYAGSFYAFAIWIGFGVIAIWNLLKDKVNSKASALIALLICTPVPYLMGTEGWDDHNRANRRAAENMGQNYLAGCDENAIIITQGDNDTFPLWNVQEVEGYRDDVRVMNFMLSASDWYCHQMAQKVYNSDAVKLTLKPKQYSKGINDVIFVEPNGKTITIQAAVNFIADDRNMKNIISYDKKHAYIPASKIRIPIDSAAVAASGLVPEHLKSKIVKYIDIPIDKISVLYKNSLLLMDVIATNKDWSRPLYFTSPDLDGSFNLMEYMHLEGYSYKFLPVKADHYIPGFGGINAEKSYDVMMDKYKYGNLDDPRVVIDRETMRNISITRQYIRFITDALVAEGKNDQTIKLLDSTMKWLPISKAPLDFRGVFFIDTYKKAGAEDKAIMLAELLLEQNIEQLQYYMNQNPKVAARLEKEKGEVYSAIYYIAELAVEYGWNDIGERAMVVLYGKNNKRDLYEENSISMDSVK